MARTLGNNAYKEIYDYDQLQVNKGEYSRNIRLEPKRSRKAKIRLMILQNIALITIIATCSIVLIQGYSTANVLTKKISTLTNDLSVLQSQSISLNAQINQMFNLEYVEQYAVAELGMIKLDPNQIEQIHIQNKDIIETYETENKFKKVVETVQNIFINIWEYIN